MTKINFQNLPSTTTPVNATNLNQLQTNVENAISAQIGSLITITNPLTKNNVSLTDGNISNAKLILITYTFQYGGANYENSILIATTNSQWQIVNHFDGSVGYIVINKANGTISTSAGSATNFAIVKYLLIK